MEPFKWGIIGPGSIARDFTDDLKYVNRPQKITAVLSHREESARKFAEEFKIQAYYTDINRFLQEADIDAVYIASPHTSHYEQTLACLHRQIPVLCEKPLVINAEQAKNLVEAAEENNTFLLEGMWIRFLPSIHKLLDLIASGAIGKLVSVKASMSYKAPEDPENRYYNPELGGGSLLDLGIYPVFLSTLLMGKPDRIHAVGKLSDEGIDETCAVLFKYDDGRHAMLESSIITQTELSAEIAGDNGVIKILSPWNEKPESIRVTMYDEDRTATDYPCEWEGRGFQYEVEEVLSCLNNKQIYSNQYSHQFSLDVMEIMDKIRKQLHVTYNAHEESK
jgi:predicted dehydrogenase